MRQTYRLLVPKWVFHVRDATKLETTPLVYDGVMYISHTNEVYAVDAVTGRTIWHHRSDGGVGRQNRGVALWGDGLFFITVDCHLVKLDRVTGSLIWDQEFASNAEGYTSSLAPLVVKGQVLVGTAGGGSGQRGFVGALSASTGRRALALLDRPRRRRARFRILGRVSGEVVGRADLDHRVIRSRPQPNLLADG